MNIQTRPSIFAPGRTLNRVEEIMTDLLLCELAGTEPVFIAEIALSLNIKHDFTVSSVRRSVHESSLGETDVEIILSNGIRKCGLLIENKVRANLMPNQLMRYRIRGQEGVDKGDWDEFYVLLFSPEKYVSTLSDEELDLIDGALTYEWTSNWLRNSDASKHAFKIHLLTEAIADARVGYTKKRDFKMSSFHEGVYKIARTEYPDLKMAWSGTAGHDDSIIHLPDALPVRGDKLLLKAKMGSVDLRVETRDPIGMERALNRLIDGAWKTTRAKQYAGVEIAMTPIDLTQDFEVIEPCAREYLDGLYALQNFYHETDVANLIEQHRGKR